MSFVTELKEYEEFLGAFGIVFLWSRGAIVNEVVSVTILDAGDIIINCQDEKIYNALRKSFPLKKCGLGGITLVGKVEDK